MDTFKSNNGQNSSKRIIGSLVVIWSITMASFYIINIQLYCGKESLTIENILITFVGTGALMITGGVLDGLFNKRTELKNEPKK